MENVGLGTSFSKRTRGSIDENFWRGRRVFLTGHTGFKGSWLSVWLTHLGAKLTGFSLGAPTEINMFELVGAHQGMTSLLGDIRDQQKLTAAIHSAEPEIIIHMAAQPLVRASYSDPVGTYATNIMGTVHVLDAVRSCPSVRGVLIVTSDKCYENREWGWRYRENEAMGGYDPYSSSKGCAELVTSAYRRSYFNPEAPGKNRVAIATARAGNVIGGGDWAADRIVPDAIRAFIAGVPVDVRNPSAVRPWQHVIDPLHGYLQLCQQLLSDDAASYTEGWNFGPHASSECPVEQVLDLLIKNWGGQASWRNTSDPAALHEAHCLKLDCSKTNLVLGWTPQYSLLEALAMTAEWYKDYQDKKDLRAVTLRQINSLMQSAAK